MMFNLHVFPAVQTTDPTGLVKFSCEVKASFTTTPTASSPPWRIRFFRAEGTDGHTARREAVKQATRWVEEVTS